jgi:hypothetical protein
VERSQAFALFNDGLKPKDLVREHGVGKVAYKWYAAYNAENPTITEIPPTEDDTAPPVKPLPTVKGKKAAGSITEETAGYLLSGMFAIYATMSKEELWFLTDTETHALRIPFSESLKSLPAPVANMVNAYSPPLVFVATLASVISQKQDAIRVKQHRAYDPVAQRAAHMAREANQHGVPVEEGPIRTTESRSTGVTAPEDLGSVFERHG